MLAPKIPPSPTNHQVMVRWPALARSIALGLLGPCLAMIASVANGATPADAPLGTLFYSPTERTAITGDRQQQLGAQARSSHLTVSGVVKRERGNSTAWVNGQAVHEGQPGSSATRLTMRRGGVTLNGTPVRVGETLDLLTQERRDLVTPGAVTLRSSTR